MAKFLPSTLILVIFMASIQIPVIEVNAGTPLVCFTAPQRAEALEIANGIALIIDSSLKFGSLLFKDANKRAEYTNYVNQIITALQKGWAAPGVCDSIANPIGDALAVIPFGIGPLISGIVKPSVKLLCENRKKELGC